MIQWPHVNSTIYEAETIQYCKDEHVTLILVDASGLATSHERYEQAGLNSEGIKFTDEWKNQAVDLYHKLLSGEKLHVHPRFAELKRQMTTQLRKAGMGHTPKYTEPSGDFDDQLWALIMACWGAREYLGAPKEIAVASKKFRYEQSDEFGSGIPKHLQGWVAGERTVYYPE